jgi:hypothetical protein
VIAANPTSDPVDELLHWAREQLGIGPDRPWRLISSRRKLRKILFEFEECTPDGPRRCIAKVSESKNTRHAFRMLQLLWESGMRPPSSCCVVAPIAFFPEKHLLLQEKAPGTQLREKIRAGSATAADGRRAAAWLLHLQGLDLPHLKPGTTGNLERVRQELPSAIPSHSTRIIRILECVAASQQPADPLLPSHGDFHPMNLYLTPEQVTAIDLDTVALREPAYDVAYFVAQAAIMGYLVSEGFAGTEELRSAILDEFRRAAPDRLDMERITVHVVFALLRSLHYDFCILHSKPEALVEPFLSAVERIIATGDVRLTA